ncbi:hypothetical protein BKA80DRAFT_52621 [Phyllosticta citrichinensis]
MGQLLLPNHVPEPYIKGVGLRTCVLKAEGEFKVSERHWRFLFLSSQLSSVHVCEKGSSKRQTRWHAAASSRARLSSVDHSNPCPSTLTPSEPTAAAYECLVMEPWTRITMLRQAMSSKGYAGILAALRVSIVTEVAKPRWHSCALVSERKPKLGAQESSE